MAQRVIEFLVFYTLKINIYSSRFGYLRNKIRQSLNIFFKEKNVRKKSIERLPSHSLKTYLHSDNYLDEVVSSRRSNYLAIHKLFAEYANDLLYKELHKDVVPHYFILLSDDNVFSDKLRQKGIGCSRWPGPELPRAVRTRPDLYPIAHRLNKSLLFLPVHQDVNVSKLKQLAKDIR